jgi:hypothetical protein
MGYIYGMGSLLCLPKSEQEATLKRFHEFDEEVLEGHSEVQKFINLYETNYEEMSFDQMIKAWGWDATYDEEDNLIHLVPLSDYLPDEAELFFRILASSVQDQGYVELEEEGVRYRWYFLKGYAIEQEAVHTYPSDEVTLSQIEKLIEEGELTRLEEAVLPHEKDAMRTITSTFNFRYELHGDDITLQVKRTATEEEIKAAIVAGVLRDCDGFIHPGTVPDIEITGWKDTDSEDCLQS